MGAILLDPTLSYVLLLRGFKSNAAWGFPRGKIGNGERDADCAIREVFEETGIDIRDALVEEDFIEINMGEQRIKLYIIPDIPLSTAFAPQTRGEVGAYAWHELKDLPSTKEEFASFQYVSEDGKRHRFFMLWPFIKRVKVYIKQRRKNLRAGKQVKKGKIKAPVAAAEPPVPESSVQAAPGGNEAGSGKSQRRREGQRRRKKERTAQAAPATDEVAEPVPEPDAPHVAQISHRSHGPSAWLSFRLDVDAVMRQLGSVC
mmetsp:Transcript_27777/g.71485  ORF Transcript_27777/g.71485 Transcript_27777/m.71485 type:complete len:259 (-) Transcript_27777:278-1054(-)